MAESRHRWLYSPRRLPSADEVVLAAAEGGNPKAATMRLVQAIIRREWDVFQQLLPNVNLNDHDKFGFTPLLRSIHKRRPQYLAALLEQEDLDVRVCDKMNRTALHIACETRNLEALTALLNYSQERLTDAERLEWIDTADVHGYTALIRSIQRGYFSQTKTLLQAGATPTKTDDKHQSPLYIACSRGYLDMVQILLRTTDPELIPTDQRAKKKVGSPLGIAVMKNHGRVVDFILEQRRIDLSSLHGRTTQWTYLMWAVTKGNLEVANVLLDHGAPLWILDEMGSSVFDLKMSVAAKRSLRPRVLEQFYDCTFQSPLCMDLKVPPEVVRIVLMFAYY